MDDETQVPARHRGPPDEDRTTTNRSTIIGAVLLVLALIGVALLVFIPRAAPDSAPSAPAPAAPSLVTSAAAAPVAVVDPSQAPAPGMDPQFAPPDGPALDLPPFDVDAIAMRQELRTHGVDLPDDKLGGLVAVADKYIAEDVPDLKAWDPRIMRDVRALWPNESRRHVVDVTRCLAEYVERVIARNHGWAHPPDEDDHKVPVKGGS
jgi:hypothetical protein